MINPPKASFLRHPESLLFLGTFFAGMLLLVLGVASMATTRFLWDGSFPSGAYRLRIQNPAGEPVVGATFTVFYGASSDMAYDYPIDNFTAATSLVSDAQGEIVVWHVARGIEFGGQGWYLFWVFPMGNVDGPYFEYEIAATGYRPHRTPLADLFQRIQSTSEGTTLTVPDGVSGTTTVKVVEHVVVLQKP